MIPGGRVPEPEEQEQPPLTEAQKLRALADELGMSYAEALVFLEDAGELD